MLSKRPFRESRDVPGGINPGSFGRKGARGGGSHPSDGRNAWAPPGAALGKSWSRFPAVGVMLMACSPTSNTSIGTASSTSIPTMARCYTAKRPATEILVVKAEHEYGGSRLNPRKADLQRWRERFADYLVELGVAATATRREDRGFVRTNKKTPIYRAAHRQRQIARPREASAPGTPAGDSVFMRRKLEAVKRELRTRGKVADRESYRAAIA
jgi:hypothetical protein